MVLALAHMLVFIFIFYYAREADLYKKKVIIITKVYDESLKAVSPQKGAEAEPLSSAVVVFLFLAGLWFTGANMNGPNFHPKLTLAAQTIGYRRLMLCLMLTGPAGLC